MRLIVLLLVLLFLAVVAALVLVLTVAFDPDATHAASTAQPRPPPTLVDLIEPSYPLVTTTTSTTSTTIAPRARTAPIVHAAPTSGVIWDAIAACESGGHWDDRRDGYEGGLHFLNSTWLSAGGGRFAAHAYDASRVEQIEVADAWLARTSWAQWPVCSRKVGAR